MVYLHISLIGWTKSTQCLGWSKKFFCWIAYWWDTSHVSLMWLNLPATVGMSWSYRWESYQAQKIILMFPPWSPRQPFIGEMIYRRRNVILRTPLITSARAYLCHPESIHSTGFQNSFSETLAYWPDITAKLIVLPMLLLHQDYIVSTRPYHDSGELCQCHAFQLLSAWPLDVTETPTRGLPAPPKVHLSSRRACSVDKTSCWHHPHSIWALCFFHWDLSMSARHHTQRLLSYWYFLSLPRPPPLAETFCRRMNPQLTSLLLAWLVMVGKSSSWAPYVMLKAPPLLVRPTPNSLVKYCRHNPCWLLRHHYESFKSWRGLSFILSGSFILQQDIRRRQYPCQKLCLSPRHAILAKTSYRFPCPSMNSSLRETPDDKKLLSLAFDMTLSFWKNISLRPVSFCQKTFYLETPLVGETFSDNIFLVAKTSRYRHDLRVICSTIGEPFHVLERLPLINMTTSVRWDLL